MSDKPEQYPHQPAAFINVIAEEGSKAEAIEHLQLTWNELSFVRKERNALQSQLSAAQAMNDKLAEVLELCDQAFKEDRISDASIIVDYSQKSDLVPLSEIVEQVLTAYEQER